MKTLKMYHNEVTGGILKLASPNLKAGIMPSGGLCYIFEITEIPEEIQATEVLRLANGTTFLPAKYDGTGRYSYRFDELGLGKIIHA